MKEGNDCAQVSVEQKMTISLTALSTIVGTGLFLSVLISTMAILRIKGLYIAVATGLVLFAGFYIGFYLQYSFVSLFNLIGACVGATFFAVITYCATRLLRK